MLLRKTLLNTLPLVLALTAASPAYAGCKRDQSLPATNSTTVPKGEPAGSTPTLEPTPPVDGSNSNATIVTTTVTKTVTAGSTALTQAPPRDSPKSEVDTSAALVKQAWYTDWHTTQLPIDKIEWDKYNTITYAFAIPKEDGTYTLNEETLQALSEAGQQKDVKISISIGGWTGSGKLSPVMKDASLRSKLVNSTTELITKYNLSGIDMDWEYVNDANKNGCATNDFVDGTDDKANLLSFFKELRQTAGENLTISAAVPVTAFNDKNGDPSSDVADLAGVIDYIEIMAYDIRSPGSSSVAGPAAPLKDECVNNTEYRKGSVESAVTNWKNAGFKPSQLVVGVPGYGHAFFVDKDKVELYAPSANKTAPEGDEWDAKPGSTNKDACTGQPEMPSGVWNFVNLYPKYLDPDSPTKLNVTQDACSMESYVFVEPESADEQAGSMIFFDDERTFKAKGEFIKSEGLRGFAMWELASDYQSKLVDAITEGMGA